MAIFIQFLTKMLIFFYFANYVALLGSSRKAIGFEFQLRLTQEIEMQYNNIIPLT